MADEMKLRDCPPGLFMFGETLGLKTEYKAMETVGPTEVPGDQVRWKVGWRTEAYVAESGEFFWGGAKSNEDRENLIVRPIPIPPASPPACEEAPYGASHQPWLQPGDQPDRAFILRFDDADRGEMSWMGEGAEAEALKAWNLFAPTWNCWLFSSHPREEAPAEGAGERLARQFHETYERLAPSFGYETRPDTKAFDPTTPNGRLMIAVCSEMQAHLRNRTSEPEAGAVGQVNALYASGFGRMRCVEWTAGDMPEVGTKLYTHPAPATADKLRVAVEALESGLTAAENIGIFPDVARRIRQALAALNEGGE